jgi:hypothetical protein
MAKKFDGNFSLGLKSLELQVGALLEGCGGEQASALLDALGDLSAPEQERTIGLFLKVISRLKASNVRLPEEKDENLKEFEESLYNELLSSMDEAANGESVAPVSRRHKFAVLDGGKDVEPKIQVKGSTGSGTIDFNEARKRKTSRMSTFLN